MDKTNSTLNKLIDTVEPAYYWICDQLFSILPQSTPTLDTLKKAKVLAHRGVHDNACVLENTIAAFDAATKLSIAGIELDIRWTKDLIPVVFHDADLNRLFNRHELVRELTFAELRHLCPLIPSLEDVIERYGKKLHLMIELKNEPYPQLEEQRTILKNVLAPLTPADDYHIISLDPELLLIPDFLPTNALLPIAVIEPSKTNQLALEKHYGGLLGHYTFLRAAHIRAQQAQGNLLGTGHISSKNCLFRELNRGVEWIFTNNADIIAQIIREQTTTIPS